MTRLMKALLFQGLGVEFGERLFLYSAGNFYRLATNFTVFHVRLTANRKVHHHRNLFAAIGAGEKMFH